MERVKSAFLPDVHGLTAVKKNVEDTGLVRFHLVALFHCVVRLGSARLVTARHGSVRVGLRFQCSLVPL